MEHRGETPEGNPKKTPKIVKIGQNWRSIGRDDGEKTDFDASELEPFRELSIDSSNWLFEKNQNSEITIHDDGMIEVKILQVLNESNLQQFQSLP